MKKTSTATSAKKKAGRKSTELPRVRGYSSRAAWEVDCWRAISLDAERLRLLLTPHERHNLVLRAVALDRLMGGESYRQIGRELWLSPQTISGIKKAFKEKGYRSYAERSKTERKKKTYSSVPRPARRSGTPHRTKYGTRIYLPY